MADRSETPIDTERCTGRVQAPSSVSLDWLGAVCGVEKGEVEWMTNGYTILSRFGVSLTLIRGGTSLWVS
jgi:hypothetical protein